MARFKFIENTVKTFRFDTSTAELCDAKFTDYEMIIFQLKQNDKITLIQKGKSGPKLIFSELAHHIGEKMRETLFKFFNKI